MLRIYRQHSSIFKFGSAGLAHSSGAKDHGLVERESGRKNVSGALRSVHRFSFGEIFCELNEKLEIISEEGQVILARSGFEAGSSIRVNHQGATVHSFTEDLTEAGCNGLIDSIRELSSVHLRALGDASEPTKPRVYASNGPNGSLLTDIEGWSEDLKKSLVREAESTAYAAAQYDAGVKKVRVKSIVGRRCWLVVNSEGVRAVDHRLYTTVTAQSSVERGGKTQTGTYTESIPTLPPPSGS